MKKFTLFVSALVLSVAAFATAAPKARAHKSSSEPQFKVAQAQLESTDALRKQKAEGEIDTILIPYSLINADYKYITTYQVGMLPDGFGWIPDSLGLVTAHRGTTIFVNDSMLPATWYVDGDVVAENKMFYATNLQFGSKNPLPMMKTPSNSADTFYLDYQIGNLTNKAWIAGGWDAGYCAVNVAPAEIFPITNCAMYTEDPREDEEGGNYWQLGGAAQVGTYAYGTKMKNPWNSGTTFDTIIVPFNNDGVMTISDITLAIYNRRNVEAGTASSADLFPSEDDHVRVTLYPTNDAATTWYDYVDWANPIATAVANIDNFTPYSDAYSWLGLLQFDFFVPDPITGADVPGTISVEGDFIVALSEYNDGNAEFGIFADYGVSGNTKFIGWTPTDGNFAIGLWTNTHNILLNIDAYFPVFEAPEEVEFAADETEKVLSIVSNVWDDDAVVDEENLPEWITVEIASDYDLDENGYYHHHYINQLTITVAALPDGETYREGTISIDAFGLPVEILVKQGEDPAQAIDNVNFKNDGKSYNVLGIEVNEDYKGVVIRNGEKFIR